MLGGPHGPVKTSRPRWRFLRGRTSVVRVKPSQIVALLAGLALALGVWAASRQSRPRAGPDAGAGAPGKAGSGDDVVAQAMRDVPGVVDSTAIKTRWHDEVRGIDLEALDATQLELLVRFANARMCTCGCGYTLAGCKASDMSCEESGARLTALRDSILAGQVRAAKGLRTRPDG